MRVTALLAALLFMAVVAVVATMTASDVTGPELMKRCRASQPAWNGYQEDIKEIGARQVARWHGEPVALSVSPGVVRLTMALAPPWADFDAALPLLLLDPEGRVTRNNADERAGGNRIYIFDRKEAAGEPVPPWLEIQYPHTKRRLFLAADGTWNAPVKQALVTGRGAPEDSSQASASALN